MTCTPRVPEPGVRGVGGAKLEPNATNLDTQNLSREPPFESLSYDIAMTLTGLGACVPVIVTFPPQETFWYGFPANGSLWQVDDLQTNIDPRGAGLATSSHGCS